MKLTSRDLWLCAALPAVVTVLVYHAGLARSVRRDMVGLRTELERQDSADVRTARLERARKENGRLSLELRALQEHAATGTTTPASNALVEPRRVATLRDISRLCEQSHLTLVCSSPLTATTSPREPWTGARSWLDKVGWKDAEVWRLDVRGSYGDMLRMLETISTTQIPIIPIGIGMEPAAEEAKPISWILTFWI